MSVSTSVLAAIQNVEPSDRHAATREGRGDDAEQSDPVGVTLHQGSTSSAHTVGHATASLLLAAGTHTKIAGHGSYAITADVYVHVPPAQQRGAAQRLDRMLA